MLKVMSSCCFAAGFDGGVMEKYGFVLLRSSFCHYSISELETEDVVFGSAVWSGSW